MQHAATPVSAGRPRTCARRRIGRLGWLTFIVALILCVGVPATGRLLDLVSITGMPLGFHVSAQGALVLSAALLLAFAARADRLERGVGDDDDSESVVVADVPDTSTSGDDIEFCADGRSTSRHPRAPA